MLEQEELEGLKFPVNVLLIEKLDEDASDADLYNAGYNMSQATLESLQDIPEGYEIHSVIDDDDDDEEDEEEE